MGGSGQLLGTVVFTAFACLPLALSVWALLDCAHRPGWAWALSGRRQAVWMAAILFGLLMVILGIAISGWYLLKIRPEIAAAEEGRIPELDSVGSSQVRATTDHVVRKADRQGTRSSRHQTVRDEGR